MLIIQSMCSFYNHMFYLPILLMGLTGPIFGLILSFLFIQPWIRYVFFVLVSLSAFIIFVSLADKCLILEYGSNERGLIAPEGFGIFLLLFAILLGIIILFFTRWYKLTKSAKLPSRYKIASGILVIVFIGLTTSFVIMENNYKSRDKHEREEERKQREKKCKDDCLQLFQKGKLRDGVTKEICIQESCQY